MRSEEIDKLSNPVRVLLDDGAELAAKTLALPHEPTTPDKPCGQATANEQVCDGHAEADRPLEFHWSKSRQRIRAAAKEYSERTHADY